ncbi:thioesterase domain-containing protein, partial [Mediterraneibacter gnavus]
MLDSIQELVKSFVDENITMLKERKFGFLGHCSGSIVAYEAAKYAKEAYGIEPEIMFVSSCY